ncbi:hypothetical protein ACF0H5_020615 [Mactra antiquata]
MVKLELSPLKDLHIYDRYGRDMKLSQINLIVYYSLLQLITITKGRYEICRLYGMETHCKYKIDGVSLSEIDIVIDQCTNPVQVTFTIINHIPRVNFQHTFNSADTLVSIPGFHKETKLVVKLTARDDDIINVEADIKVYNEAKVDFVNDDIKLWGANEQCPGLNTAAKISVGIMGTLAVIAGTMVIILIYIKYQRTHKANSESRNQLNLNSSDTGSQDHSRSTSQTLNDLNPNLNQSAESHGFNEEREERFNEARRTISNNQYR